jgi:hypothetical protein
VPVVHTTRDDQRRSLLLHEHAGLRTKSQAARFLSGVGVALRYGAHKTLPIASMYAAVCQSIPRAEPEAEMQRRATLLTNQLIADATAIEILCVADRVALAHATMMPPLLALVRRRKSVDRLDLSATARRVLAFVSTTPRPTAGQVRAHLGVPPKTWPNRADEALAELQRALVLDRGPTDVPERGAAYLTKDGIPYRLVDDVHTAHVRAATKLSVEAAGSILLERYLDGARFATKKQLKTLFGGFLSPAELDAALARLGREVDVVREGRTELVVRR